MRIHRVFSSFCFWTIYKFKYCYSGSASSANSADGRLNPYFDLRVVNYLLALPPVPWFMHKELTRVAMRSLLPEAIVRRPKTPLGGDSVRLLFQQPGAAWVDNFKATPMLGKYVVREVVPPIAFVEQNSHKLWLNLRPLSLNYWLDHLSTANRQSMKKEYHEIK